MERVLQRNLIDISDLEVRLIDVLLLEFESFRRLRKGRRIWRVEFSLDDSIGKSERGRSAGIERKGVNERTWTRMKRIMLPGGREERGRRT